MFLLMMAVAAGAMSAPAFLDPAEIISPRDYPIQMVLSGGTAFEDVRVAVSPLGKPESCDVIGEFHDQAATRFAKTMGLLTCSLMVRRSSFRPATDVNGEPAYGTISMWVLWRNPRGPSYTRPYQVDADISVAALPSGMSDPALVDIDVAVAADGTPGACAATPEAAKIRNHQVFSSELARVACTQIGAGGKLSPAQTHSGQAVASVQRLVARFSATKAAVADPAKAN